MNHQLAPMRTKAQRCVPYKQHSRFIIEEALGIHIYDNLIVRAHSELTVDLNECQSIQPSEASPP